MVNISKVGDSAIKFTFTNNDHYLFNGEIEVPLNSLILTIDESNMATFKKIDGDPFVSFLISNSNFASKSDLESFYKDNMVGAMGGSIDSGAVQTMIDESISGKADTTAVTEAISSATADFFDGVEYDSGTTRINFYNGNTIKGYVDASAFIVDGMIDDVRIETISGVSYLVIDFNTASGKEDIKIPLTDIFNPSNYYDKTEVDAIVSGKADTTAVTESINAAVSGKADTTTVNTLSGKVDTNEEVTARALNALNGSISSKADTSAVTESINAAVSGKLDTSTFETYSGSVETALSGKLDKNGTYIRSIGTANGLIVYNDGINKNILCGKINSAQIIGDNKNFQLVETSAITSSITSASTDSQVPSAKAVYDALQEGGGGGNNVIEVTQAEYDALVSAGTVDLTALYVITDATEVDISNYYTKSEVDSSLSGKADTSAVTASINAAVSGKLDTSTFETYSGTVETALSGKQDTLSAGTNITISGNVISAEGGGKAIEAGRGISITTGATADTVSFNLPISGGSYANSVQVINGYATGQASFAVGHQCNAKGMYSFAQGQSGQASGQCSHSEGAVTYANAYCSHSEGNNVYANNSYEHSQGFYNVSNKTSDTFGDSGNTLFSVGNGTANNARHNAFEIRQNGDIYCSNGTSDVKLQDYLQVKVVQISQSDYDQLQNKDANTLYVITNS